MLAVAGDVGVDDGLAAETEQVGLGGGGLDYLARRIPQNDVLAPEEDVNVDRPVGLTRSALSRLWFNQQHR